MAKIKLIFCPRNRRTQWLLLLTVLLFALPAHAEEVTGNDWIFPITNYRSLGCKFGCVKHDAHMNHKGYDLSARKGTPIVATKSGTVVAARNTCNSTHYNTTSDCPSGATYMSGNFVKLRHSVVEDGKTVTRYTVYFHMDRAAVAEGDYVEQGDIIGYVGNTGNASGNHTCMEFRESPGTKQAHATDFVNTIIATTAATENGLTNGYRTTLRVTTRDTKLWSSPVVKQRVQVGVIPEGTELLFTIVQENYGFVEYGDLKGWVNMPDNTEFLKRAVQLDYYKNGGTGKMSNTTHVKGEDIQIPANRFTKSGYSFSGWQLYNPRNKNWLYTDGTNYKWSVAGKEGTGWSKVKFPDEGTIPGEIDLTKDSMTLIRLHATWVKKGSATYTVHYDANGGSGAMADSTGTRGIADAISPCTYTKEGYSFVGWTASRSSDNKMLYKPADGSSGATWLTETEAAEKGWLLHRYPDCGSTKSPTSVDGDVITLHAQWAASSLSLSPENGEEGWQLQIEAETPLGELPIPRRDGYYFLGWYTDPAAGTQITSLHTPEAAEQAGTNTLYAHWLPHDERPVLQHYLTRTSDGNQYALALSHLLSASGQQPDQTYDVEQCLAQLDEVGMLTSSGGVSNQKFVSSGFLERFAPELTLEEKLSCDTYDDYVSELNHMLDQGYYVMLMLQLTDTDTQWCYLYEADGTSLIVVYNGGLADAAEICQGIKSTNVFLYHGTPFYSERPHMTGTYYVEGQTAHIAMNYSASDLQPGQYTAYIAYYLEDGRMVECSLEALELDPYLRGTTETLVPDEFDVCRVFLINETVPLCHCLELETA